MLKHGRKSSPTQNRRPSRPMPIAVALPLWSWMPSRGTPRVAAKVTKVARAKERMATRTIPTRMWYVTYVERKDTERPIAGTQRPMGALVNRQVRRATPSPTPRMAKERDNRKVKAKGKAPKARLTPWKAKLKEIKPLSRSGRMVMNLSEKATWDSCAWPEGRVLAQYRPRVAQGRQWMGRQLPRSCARSTAISPGSGRGLGTMWSRSAREN